MALFAIDLAVDVGDLRKWWEEERPRRQHYHLSQAQEDEIIAACAAKKAKLETHKLEKAS